MQKKTAPTLVSAVVCDNRPWAVIISWSYNVGVLCRFVSFEKVL